MIDFMKEIENMQEVDNMDSSIDNMDSSIDNMDSSIDNMEEVDNMDEIVNNEVENPEIVKEEDMPENTEIEVKIAVNSRVGLVNSEKEGEMMKDDIPAVEDENEVEVEAPVEKASTTTTKATPTIAPLGVTLRTAATTRRARPTTRRTTTTTTARTTTQAPAPEQGILSRLGNLFSPVGNAFTNGAGLGSNIISTGSLLAAAASPLWAPLLVGKKRRKRSIEDISLNEIQQANKQSIMQYYTKLIQSHIKQAKDNYQ